MGGFYDLMDEIVAVGLGVPVETYINIIETKCTEEEATFIITTFIATFVPILLNPRLL